ncbi:unnamed protein product [Cylindrotheca closterium]|uniref:Protochlorophyllide reductase n=1 Tax=Cylindrotheca closterium TaxID=2856 RepID=A0AAD2JHT6_9STRA|nr:unnamed protein product [Cylindrotheca closterium]
MRSLLLALLVATSFVDPSQGLLLPSPKKVLVKKQICRKKFLAGVAGAAVLGTATAAGAAVAVNGQSNDNKKIYEPAPGSMDGKVVLITGASTGLGLESAKRLAAAGATIVLTSRNQAKGEKAVANVEEYVREQKGSTPKVYSLVLDLDDLENVKAFPNAYKALGLGNISVLLNNAGVMAIPDRQLTKDGYERTFQSNHLGHFVLTAGLFPYLSRDGSTVVNVSSEAFNFASQTTESGGGRGLDMKNLNGDIAYGPWTSYGLSKLANILFTQELQRKADASGNDWLTTVCLHPGAVNTDLGRNIMGEEKWNELKESGGASASPLTMFALKALSNFVLTVPEGASTQVFLASGAEGAMTKGAFYEDLKEKKSLPGFARDTAKAKALWETSETLGGVKFDPASIKAAGAAAVKID